MRVVVGSDHAGWRLKTSLVQTLRDLGHEVTDLGCHSDERVDYTDYAIPVARQVAEGRADRGLIVCGTGIGSCIAANKVAGVRAAVLSDPTSARLTRAHNDANVLCLGERVIGVEVARECLRAFLDTAFEGGRHADRLARIAALEQAAPPSGPGPHALHGQKRSPGDI
jgi:ribose 5-phosphate isomerase B